LKQTYFSRPRARRAQTNQQRVFLRAVERKPVHFHNLTHLSFSLEHRPSIRARRICVRNYSHSLVGRRVQDSLLHSGVSLFLVGVKVDLGSRAAEKISIRHNGGVQLGLEVSPCHLAVGALSKIKLRIRDDELKSDYERG